VTLRVLEYEQRLLESRASIITAEAKGDSFLQRSWRPITMLTFLALTVGDSLGWLPNPLAPQAWTLLQLGLGGYVVGRSGEKITKAIGAMKAKDHYE
jgi:hypothetical protein